MSTGKVVQTQELIAHVATWIAQQIVATAKDNGKGGIGDDDPLTFDVDGEVVELHCQDLAQLVSITDISNEVKRLVDEKVINGDLCHVECQGGDCVNLTT